MFSVTDVRKRLKLGEIVCDSLQLVDEIYPIFIDINGFKDYEKSLIEIGELEYLEDIRKEYPTLASGIFDIKENQKFSLEMFSYLDHLEHKYIKEVIYINDKVEWKSKSELLE